MNTPWFFLSYVSIRPEHDLQVKKFFTDLVGAVRDHAQVKANEFPDEDIGFCALQIPPGTDWTAVLPQRLSSCRVLVCLYSKAYFKSKQCGREFEIFRNRLNEHYGYKGTQLPPLIIPVPWVVSKNFDERFLPTALKPIQYKYSGFEDARNAKGIYYFLKISAKHKTNYDEYVENLAEIITNGAYLDPCLRVFENPIDFENTVNAFADYSDKPTSRDSPLPDPQPESAQSDFSGEAISPTKIKLRWKSDAFSNVTIERRLESQSKFKSIPRVNIDANEHVDSVLRPATTYVYKLCAADKSNGHLHYDTATVKTLPLPFFWYIVVIAGLLVLASLALRFRCSIPGFCHESVPIVPKAQPLIETREWEDHFDRNPAAGANVWLRSGEWTYPTDKWTTVKGRDKSDKDRALIVEGTTPGLTTKIYDNFTATFTVSYLSGGKAGWFLRAEEGAPGRL